MQFTATYDDSISFQMLDSEASLFFDGQEYVVKQCVPDYSEMINTIQITASHVYNETSRIWQHNVKSGTFTYSINDVLAYFLDGNTMGFTYRVEGSFGNQQITNLGNCSAKDGLSKIIETWPSATIFPNGREIVVYSSDAWATDSETRVDYIRNTREIQLTSDSTGMFNKAWVYGATIDNDSSSDSDTEQYYFEPHIVQDDDSIANWDELPGEDISDDRFTDITSMDAYAKTQFVTDPSLSFDITMNSNDKPVPGELVRVEIRKNNYVTKVQTMSFSWYPWDSTQNTTLTLNNTAKSILDYQTNQKKRLAQVIKDQKNTSNKFVSNFDIKKVGEVDD